MGREGFEPPKAEPANLQSAPFGHLGTCPLRWSNYTDLARNVNLHYVLLNVAMGGTLGGDIPAGFSQAVLVVDYIRIYQ